MTTKTYTELRQHTTFEERYAYLRLYGEVGRSTYGHDRYVNQKFYRSREWKQIRELVIIRDEGCDLGIEGFEIRRDILIHHMNPMTLDQIVHSDPDILDPEYLITTTHRTHNAIHFGDESMLPKKRTERKPGDTKLW